MSYDSVVGAVLGRPVKVREGTERREAAAPVESARTLARGRAREPDVNSLPLLHGGESLGTRRMGIFFAAIIVGLFFVAHCIYWVPAHSGVDQNGYLVGGRMLAEHGTMKFAPQRPLIGGFDPHQFVGAMWVGVDYGTEFERYYPKYPIGLPALVAACLKIGGPTWGPVLTYWINPVATTLAMAATFLLIRLVAGSFLAVLGTAVVATSPTTMQLTSNPNSHATAIFCAAWGMYLLIRWWQVQGAWRAALGGFLIGYTTTIRYTEGLLVLPVCVVVAFYLELFPLGWRGLKSALVAGLRFLAGTLLLAMSALESLFSEGPRGMLEDVGDQLRELAREMRAAARRAGLGAQQASGPAKQRWLESALLMGSWALPVVLLVSYNLKAMGTLTGYDPTNESDGFGIEYAWDNWETMLRHLNNGGLFLFFPLALAGLVALFWWNWRFATMLLSWILPCVGIYVLYYWAPDSFGMVDHMHIGYLRFFLTILPALAMAAFWVIARIDQAAVDAKQIGLARTVRIGAGVMCFIAIAVHLHDGTNVMEMDRYSRLILQMNTEYVLANVPANSVVICPDQGLLHHLTFVRDYQTYTGETFNKGYIQNLPNFKWDDPNPLDPGRRDSLYKRLKDLDPKQLGDAERKIMSDALSAGERVFFILPRVKGDPLDKKHYPNAKPRPAPEMVRRFVTPEQFDWELTEWWSIAVPYPKPPEQAKPRQQRPQPPAQIQRAQMYQIVEITKKAPTTQPTTRPGEKK